MNKKILATLVSTLFMTGFVSAQTQTTTNATPAATPACCDKPSSEQKCLKKNCGHDVLTKEERHRFCCAKAAALAENPSLVGQKSIAAKRALSQAIVKKDPTMQPIIEKLKQHWRETHKGSQESCNQASAATAPVAK